MSSITFSDRRISNFMDRKTREHPELRKDVDQLIEDLVREDRTTSVF